MEESKTIKTIEKIFWIYLYINPFLDMTTGFYYNIILGYDAYEARILPSLGITPSLVVRMVFLLAMAIYLLIKKETKSICALLPIGAAFILSVASEFFTFGPLNLSADVQYIVKFAFNLMILMVFSRVIYDQWGNEGTSARERFELLLNVTAIALSLSILLPAIFGVGFNTYADKYGYRGYCGFFFAGNDVTAILALIQPLVLGFAMRDGKDKRPWLSAIASALTANTLLIIGSKTAFLACFASYGMMLGYGVFESIKEHNKKILKGFGLSGIATIAVFGTLLLITSGRFWEVISESFGITKVVIKNDGAERAILSGRTGSFRDTLDSFKDGGILVWLFGLSRGSREITMEMDIFECFFYYGLFGAVALLWIYIREAVIFVINLFKNFNVVSFANLIALGLIFGYLFLAGHVLFTVTSGVYLSLGILYSKVLFAEEKKDVLLWGRKKK